MRKIAIIPVFKEKGKIGKVLSRFPDGILDEVCMVVDAPDSVIMKEFEESRTLLKTKVRMIQNRDRAGMANALRQGFRYALSQSYDVIVIMAGNNKDNPQEIPNLLAPILHEGYDYVQGSRFITGGTHNTPFFRLLNIKLYTLLWRLLIDHDPCADVTNGFRAYKSSILTDDQIDVWQDWLKRYSIEFYIHFKVLTVKVPMGKGRKYRVKEVPVSKIYEDMRGGYSKISLIRDFWSITGPPILLRLGIRK